MKQIIATGLFLIASTVVGFSQFSDKGYKDLKLGMSKKEVEKIVKINDYKSDSGYGNGTIKYDGLEMNISFWDDENGGNLADIACTNPKAKIKNISSELIGRKFKEVKNVLGAQLVAADLGEGEQTTYYIYYINDKAKENYESSCLLTFTDDGILESIRSVYNP